MKHGRSGKPNLRRLYCDECLLTLFWREAELIAGSVGSVSDLRRDHSVTDDEAQEEKQGFAVFDVLLRSIFAHAACVFYVS